MWSFDWLLGTLSYVVATVIGMLIAACRLPKKKNFPILVAASGTAICAIRYLLMAWIRLSPSLVAALAATGYRKTQKELTPIQVRLIQEHLGEPLRP